MAYSVMPTRSDGYTVLGADWNTIKANFDVIARGFCQGRLTLTSGSPEADNVGAAANVYFTPNFEGNLVSLFNGSVWVLYEFSEVTLSLSGLAANTNFDVFLYDNGGTLTLDGTAWTNATTRATALTTVTGVLVKSGATTRRYLGTFRTTGTVGQTTDIAAFRYVWNYYNRLRKAVQITDTTDSWSYASTTWRAWNNNVANSIGIVSGLDNALLDVTFVGLCAGSGVVGLNLDSAGKDDLAPAVYSSASVVPLSTRFCKRPGLGYHFLQLSEASITGTTTFYGDNGTTLVQAGAEGFWEC